MISSKVYTFSAVAMCISAVMAFFYKDSLTAAAMMGASVLASDCARMRKKIPDEVANKPFI